MKLRMHILIPLLLILLFVAIHALREQSEAQIVGPATNRTAQGRYPSDFGRSWSTYGAKTDTSNLQLQAAPGTGIRVYLYEAFCVNTSASTVSVALIKYSTTTVAAVPCAPANARVHPLVFDPPLSFPANTAVTFNAVTSATTNHLFAQGTTAR